MIPVNTQIDTDQVAKGLKLVGVPEKACESTAEIRPALRPELRAAFEASWKRNEAAYRYLGR